MADERMDRRRVYNSEIPHSTVSDAEKFAEFNVGIRY